MPGPSITLPTPGGSLDTWGTTLNTAINAVNDYDLFKRKAADESVTSSIVLQNDDDLFFSVLANGIYLLGWDLRIDGATAGDLRYAFTGPAGATMLWSSQGHTAADTTNVAQAVTDVAAIGTNVIHGTLGAGTPSHVRGNGVLVVAGTAGTLNLQFAQSVSSATATRLLTGSWLLGRRVA